MPRLPGPLQTATPSPSVRVPDVVENPLHGATAEIGRAISSSADMLAEAFAREKKEVDATRVDDLTNKARGISKELEVGENGYLKKVGRDAVTVDLVKMTMTEYDKRTEELIAEAENDDQRRALKTRLDAQRIGVLGNVQTHRLEQNRVYQKDTYGETMRTLGGEAVSRYDDPIGLDSLIAQAEGAADRYAGVKGVDKEALRRESRAPIHIAAITAAVDDNPDLAKAYLHNISKDAKTKNDLTAQQKLDLGKLIKEGGALKSGQSLADEALSKFDDEQKALAFIRGKAKGDEEKFAVADAKARFKEREDAKEGTFKAFASQGWDAIVARSLEEQAKVDAYNAELAAGKEPSEFVQTPVKVTDIPATVWSGMKPEDRKQIMDYVNASNAKKKRTQDDWEKLDEVETKIDQGVITDKAALTRYSPFFTTSTNRMLRKRLAKKGTISNTLVKASFLDRKGKTIGQVRGSSNLRKEWIAYQDYIYSNVAESRRPEDLDVWANTWFNPASGAKDSWFSNDPETYGEYVAKGRGDEVIMEIPDGELPAVRVFASLLSNDDPQAPTIAPMGSDENPDAYLSRVYVEHYTDAQRALAAMDMPSDGRHIAAYVVLKDKGMDTGPESIRTVLRNPNNQKYWDQFK